MATTAVATCLREAWSRSPASAQKAAGRHPWIMPACRLNMPERFAMAELNMAASMIPISPLGSNVRLAAAKAGFLRIGKARQYFCQIGINDTHGHGRNEPNECAHNEEQKAEQGNFLRRALVIHTEIALCHRARVVANAGHQCPTDDVRSSCNSMQVKRDHLRRKRMVEDRRSRSDAQIEPHPAEPGRRAGGSSPGENRQPPQPKARPACSTAGPGILKPSDGPDDGKATG